MKLGERDLSLISLGEDKYLSHLKDLDIEINGKLFTGLTIIFRLLTLNELKLVDKFLPGKQDKRDSAASITIELEEDIFKKCVHHIFNIENIDDIDLDKIEAGVISTISGLILRQSYQLVQNPIKSIESFKPMISILDQIQLVVCKYYNMSYKDIVTIPLDELLKKYAVIDLTFPDQTLKFKQEGKEDK